ncbi:chemotaxis protein CheD [Massilia sp. Root351]|jgi:chemotaxis protein CheD|uniref:chemotaxis protein CheD n=1 Tax=Massilia sp. Root351 TaxID=1736522 RepID=UPI0009ECBA14|nr:chemotaxis protein CheD [Massilia sp. Root351]
MTAPHANQACLDDKPARDALAGEALAGGELLQVGIGQLKVAGRAGQLQAVLGSCIGIAFIWEKGGRCGLAHCLLPEPRGACDAATGARYVSQAVPSLLRLMGARQADYPDITVVLAGGASMLCSKRLCVGQENAAAARKYLGQCGLEVRYCELGGRHGRQLLIDCARHSYIIKDITPSRQEAIHEHH